MAIRPATPHQVSKQERNERQNRYKPLLLIRISHLYDQWICETLDPKFLTPFEAYCRVCALGESGIANACVFYYTNFIHKIYTYQVKPDSVKNLPCPFHDPLTVHCVQGLHHLQQRSINTRTEMKTIATCLQVPQ